MIALVLWLMLVLIMAGSTAAAEWAAILNLSVDVLGVLTSGALTGWLVWRRRARRAPSPARPAGNAGAGKPPPAQLPRDTSEFVGRVDELDGLLSVASDQQCTPAVAVVAIIGMAGIGKTALAVHAAHRLAERYPDGQVFIDLHGHTAHVKPMKPAEALARLLRDLSTSAESTSSNVDELATTWRSHVAGRRMLILLDNAEDAAQVIPLLPGQANCLVLVTSRRRLAGLDTALTLSLGPLPLADATALFAHVVRHTGLMTEPAELVERVVELCARLPLAIQIAAQLASGLGLADLIERLRDEKQRLTELDDGERNVAAAIEVSYARLATDQRRLYRLLGLHPGADFEAYAAAAMADTTPRQARRLLDQLLNAQLLRQSPAGRYAFHDLVREHAAQFARHDGRSALIRLLDHCRRAAWLAVSRAHPVEQICRPPAPRSGLHPPDVSNAERAKDWLDAELPNLVTLGRYAAENGYPEHALHLSATLHDHLCAQGRYSDAHDLHCRALRASKAVGDRSGAMRARLGLGFIYRMWGRYDDATDSCVDALADARAIGDRAGEMHALLGLGGVDRRLGRIPQAGDYYEKALEISLRIGDPSGELSAVIGLGWVHRRQGQIGLAADRFRRALPIARAMQASHYERQALVGLGAVHGLRGHYEQAMGVYREILDLATRYRDRTGELHGLTGLGQICQLRRRYPQAISYQQRALEIARFAGHRTTEASALVGLGHIHRLQGEYERAMAFYLEALTLAQQIDDRHWKFEAMHGLGRAYVSAKEPGRALGFHLEAVKIATELRPPDDQARAHDGLATAYQRLHRPELARRHWECAAELLSQHGMEYTDDIEANATSIAARLAQVDGGPPTSQ